MKTTTSPKHLNLTAAQARHLHDTGSLLVVVPMKNPDWYGCITGDCPHDTYSECKAALAGFAPLGKPGDVVLCREPWADVNTESGPAFMYGDGSLRFCGDDAWPVEYERYPGCQFTMWFSDLYHAKERKCTDDHKWRSITSMPEFLIRLRPVLSTVECRRVDSLKHDEAVKTGYAGHYDYRLEYWHRRYRRRGPEYAFDRAWGFFYTLTIEKGTTR